MRRYKVAFSPEAEADLLDLYDYIADRSGTQRAIGYVARIEAYCQGLQITPNRGTRRDDIRPGLRIVGFERRATIAFQVESNVVTIMRILYGGRDLVRALGERP